MTSSNNEETYHFVFLKDKCKSGKLYAMQSKTTLLGALLLMVMMFGFVAPAGARTIYDQSFPVTSSPTSTPKCFVVVPSESIVLSQNESVIVVRFTNGTTSTYSSLVSSSATGSSIHPCTSTEGQAPTINGWIEDAYNSLSSGTYTYMTDNWPVPSAPTSGSGSYGGPLTYLFNGIQNTQLIFQPVLAYGCEAGNILYCSMGGNYWWLSAEACNSGCSSTTPIKVTPGDTIVGTVTSDSTYCAPNAAYDITVDDTTSSQSATLKNCASAGYGTLGFPAVLEAYNIGSCSNLPNEGGGMNFNSITSTPSQSYAWGTSLTSGLSPSCSFGLSSSSTSVTLYFT